MKLRDLAALIPNAIVRGNADIEITGISNHSRRLLPGELFVCISGIPGYQEDRHPYAGDAVQAGAVAIVAERDIEVDVPVVLVKDSRHALAVLSAHFYDYPSRELTLIGVTGTNGKTTTAHMIDAILRYAGSKTGLMGNIGTKIGDTLFETDINTQEPPVLQANLRRMVDAGCSIAVMEVTSQGLDAGRVLGCEFRSAVFTNITQDHLDYHGTMERYIAAKGLFFSRLGNGFSDDPAKRKFAVLNADDNASSVLRKLTAANVLTYGIREEADVRAEAIQLSPLGTSFRVVTYNGTAEMQFGMVGTFNVYNALAAITAALAEGLTLEIIQGGLASLPGVPGRMEVVNEGQPFLVLVDYAHTPDGLDNLLRAVRGVAGQRVITVFGCGGDRDRTKRPIMGGIAVEHSDYVIVTSDNPRSENPEQILADIEVGLREKHDSGDSYELTADRAEAITRAISMANPGDVVVIAGKGHETYQITSDGTTHFDDREVARDKIRVRMD
ncbi:UDP-N-acetylmuramoyl-L-alanyl-D-glutamate--2,6-diaminopimelate ligase [Paenibacillus marchantiophytorum]|uniref:UDP-N-acetylmuramoyl-L-alanyl-D-glutamate--2,6-diaminopimelate ligase n=1 Tax=Paenibacillus marchantiophytorum TaxID=1619310 RepID=A0ABQ1FIC7_9BACL|nr:UDP-N-acetylmuramoyl-L-alanyl-D-glutamate--2,6-diaminopimelate ligase [Paenibacillus marchantiophytorum]GGA16127.1 UDP-N-acetylmuramoyl-L-alanyl-D-glutamate--2,6-diaminopimelate ligase [Paenibacillus marchantiophytorum]